ncbi:DUF1349 domain-containing protein [Kineosporia sp. R_H_3]|uniref:DUF1349 domain-containing protein n=1 Tax=Kineosporia sp. R_H_3 TaxID=1961848 RepID=UPI00130465A7|nr:DUF1349 domain-containing protein [Kineosporia sp. R_H_3]
MQLTPARGVFGDEPVWFHEPARWRRSGPDIVLTADPGSDFWRHTHYGYVHDNGHFLGARMLGDFVASTTVDGQYRTGGDQAGLMVRMDAERWITVAVERVDGGHRIVAVVTHGVSDRSVVPVGRVDGPVGLRVVRSGDGLSVEFSLDAGVTWVAHRLCYLPPDLPAFVGPMAGSPAGDGFEVVFRDIVITKP